MLSGPDLASVQLVMDLDFDAADWLVLPEARRGCEGDTRAQMTSSPNSRLDQPAGWLGVSRDNCRRSWGEWSAVVR